MMMLTPINHNQQADFFIKARERSLMKSPYPLHGENPCQYANLAWADYYEQRKTKAGKFISACICPIDSPR